ncbi:MAG: S4 domain-containing protein, partial [Lysobacterales bacterium]
MNRKRDTAIAAPPPERLQKLMAAAGLGSRRALEERIRSGDVRVNDAPAQLGATVSAGDIVAFEQHRWTVVAQPLQHR